MQNDRFKAESQSGAQAFKGAIPNVPATFGLNMLTRNLVLPLVVTGAIGVPMMMSNPGVFPEYPNGEPQHSSQTYLPIDAYGTGVAIFAGDQAGPDMTAGPLEFMPISDLSTVFTWDKSVDQIRADFRRLSVVPAENGWQGLRSDLVTGTGVADLHGCITWYFDSSGQMQRIAFRGWTGDYRHLKSLLADRFLLTSSGQAGLKETMTLGSWGSTTSAAAFQLPQVIRQDSPQRQFAVTLELNRSSSYSISPTMQAAMQ